MTKYNYLSGRPTAAKKQAGTQDRERECTLRGTKYSEETNKYVHRIVRERERETESTEHSGGKILQWIVRERFCRAVCG